jgi:hypothetical protein
MSRLCLYAPHFTFDCMDLGCRKSGGRCEVVELQGGRRTCRCVVLPPSTNVAEIVGGQAVDDPLTIYLSKIAQLETCDDGWFGDALHSARAGDDDMRRRIVGSCLQVALQAAKRVRNNATNDELMSIIEDANYGLWRSVDTFTGSTATEFVRHAEQAVDSHLSQFQP